MFIRAIKLISVHIPKTAGTSFRHSLQDHFGDGLFLKYGEKPFNTPVTERNRKALKDALDNLEKNFSRVKCIHGHYLPVQFLLLSNTVPMRFVTWMRHPVDRLVSDYHHTLKNYDKNAPPFQKQIISEKWTLEQYCTCEKLKDVYSQFFWAFPLENFDFIGITEYYNADFEYFRKKFLKPSVPAYHENVNKGYKRDKLDKGLRKAIETFHAADMMLYERALELRNLRISSPQRENLKPDTNKTQVTKKSNLITTFFNSFRN